MKYEEAIINIINRHGREVLKDNFKTRAILSDLVGSSIYDSHLVSCFCWLNENINLSKLYDGNDIKQYRATIVAFYKKEKTNYSKEDIQATVNPLTSLLCKEEVQKPIINSTNENTKATRLYDVKLNGIKKLTIKCGKDKTNIGISYNNSLNVVSGYNKINLSKKVLTNKETMIIDLKSVKGEVTVNLPKNKIIPILNIEAGSSLLLCHDEITTKETIIKSKTFVAWYGACEKLTIKSKDEVHVICSRMHNVNIRSENDITYYLYTEEKELNLSCYSSHGTIRGSFINGKTYPRVVPWFRKVNRVNTTSMVKRTHVNYDLYAPNGKIKVK